eukprot:169615_1
MWHFFAVLVLIMQQTYSYIGVTIQYSFNGAEDYCLYNHQSHLATISSSIEQSSALAVCTTIGSNCWIGLNDMYSSNNYVWVENPSQTVSYFNWQSTDDDPDHSGSSCVYMYVSTGEWEDTSCTDSRAFLCNDANTATPPSNLGYIAVAGTYTWPKADDYCYFNYQSHLATIKNNQQNDEVANKCRDIGTQRCWIGINNMELSTVFKWKNDSSVAANIFEWWYYYAEPDYGWKQCGYIGYMPSHGRHWIDIDCTSTSTVTAFVCDPPNTALPPTSIGFIGVSLSYTFYDADDYCFYTYQSHLATIQSEQENDEISNICYNLVSGNHECWIGGNNFKFSSQFEWINDSSSLSYNKWYWDAEPDYGSFSGVVISAYSTAPRYWWDQTATYADPFICNPVNSSITPTSLGYIGYISAFVGLSSTFYDADDYCQYNHNSHLATITSEAENHEVVNNCRNLGIHDCWIGINNLDFYLTWQWMGDSTAVVFDKWYPNEPGTSNYYCGRINNLGAGYGRYWDDVSCSGTSSAFICNPPNTGTTATSNGYIGYAGAFIENIYTFYDANDFCYYTHMSHLATITSEEENNEVANLCRDLGNYDCWIGLNNIDFYLTWQWINDSTDVVFNKWYPNEPSTSTLQATIINNKGAGYGRYWTDRAVASTSTGAFICNPPNTTSAPSSLGYIGYIGAFTGVYNFYDTTDYCYYNHNSHLATIKSEAANNEVANVCRDLGKYDCRIGLNNIDHYLVWSWINDSKTADYTKWYPSEPGTNSRYAAIINNAGAGYGRYWTDTSCTASIAAFVCNPPNTAEPSTLNDYIGYISGFVGLASTFYDADDYCYYKHNSHLATIKSEAENNEVANICRDLGNYDCWIGVNNLDHYLTWKWINDSTSIVYDKFYPGEPGTSSNFCGLINNLGAGYGRYWTDTSCAASISAFICDPPNSAAIPSSNGYIGYVGAFIGGIYTFYDADDYCFYSHISHLATITSEAENNQVVNLCRDLGVYDCWIGLNNINFYLTWEWINDSTVSTFEKWYPGEPGTSSNYATIINNMGASYGRYWIDRGASSTSTGAFICNPPNTALPPAAIGYNAVPQSMTFSNANLYCEATYFSTLAVITSDSENDAFANLCRSMGGVDCWIGYTDSITESIWLWMDGDSSSYTHWYPGYPITSSSSYDCASMNSGGKGTGRYWVNGGCTVTKYFICGPHPPTAAPTNSPTNPTNSPSNAPSNNPSISPSLPPTFSPSNSPSNNPTISPTLNPSYFTYNPTLSPSLTPTLPPSLNPTLSPSISPSLAPSNNPS